MSSTSTFRAACLCLLVVGCCCKPKVPMSTVCPKKCKSHKCYTRCAHNTVLEWSQAVVQPGLSHNETLARFFGFLTPDLPSGEPGVTVRVEPVGTFPGRDMIAEYLTVFTNPSGPSNLVTPQGFTMRRYTSEWPVAAATIDYKFRSNMNGRVGNLTIEQWFRFDSSTNRVIYGDFNLLRYAAFITEMQILDTFVASPVFAASFLMAPVCKTSADYCSTVPSLVQYNSTKSCTDFLSSIPLFKLDAVGSNTVVCRYLHAALLPSAPAVHCPHIGPSGGGKCTDITYNGYFTGTPFTEEIFVSK